MKNRSAFTMIELIFVIVVLGILAAVAIPRMGPNIERAKIAKAQGDVAAIRASIASARQKMLVTGTNAYPSHLDTGVSANTEGVNLFDTNGSVQILTYPVYASNGEWMKTGDDKYTFDVGGTKVTFAYGGISSGLFDCHSVADNDTAKKVDYCKQITE